MNGPLKFLTARKILPLLDLLAKFKRVLACSCSPNFCVARKLAKQIFYFCSCSQKKQVLGMLANARKDHSSPLYVKDRSNKRDPDFSNWRGSLTKNYLTRWLYNEWETQTIVPCEEFPVHSSASKCDYLKVNHKLRDSNSFCACSFSLSLNNSNNKTKKSWAAGKAETGVLNKTNIEWY